MKRSQFSKGSRVLAPFVGLIAVLIASSGHASPFPNFPLQTGTGSVPPNILFVMDDSGSMGSLYMGADGDYIRRNLSDDPSQRSYVNNFLYYNPEIDYQPWMDWNNNRLTGGTSYDAAFAHFDLAEGPIDLGDPESCYWSISNGSNTKICGGDQTFWVPDPNISNPGTAASNYVKYTIRASDLKIERCVGGGASCELATPTERTEEEERNNYARWFSYHRSRMKVAKAGATEAFGQLTENYRVGYDSIWRLAKGGAQVRAVPGRFSRFPLVTTTGFSPTTTARNGSSGYMAPATTARLRFGKLWRGRGTTMKANFHPFPTHGAREALMSS